MISIQNTSVSFSRFYLSLQLALIVVMIMLDITAAISFSKKNIKNYIMFPMKVTKNKMNTPMIVDADVSTNNHDDDDNVHISINLCRICKTYYNPLQNTMKSCRFHKGS